MKGLLFERISQPDRVQRRPRIIVLQGIAAALPRDHDAMRIPAIREAVDEGEAVNCRRCVAVLSVLTVKKAYCRFCLGDVIGESFC